MNNPPTDAHGLLTSGEALATEPELAKLLGVSRNALGILLRGPLYAHVRFVRMPPGAGRGGYRYSVEDARTAIEWHRPAVEERRRKAAEQEAAERAAAAARKAAKAPTGKPAPPALGPRRLLDGRHHPSVEVVMRRRPGE